MMSPVSQPHPDVTELRARINERVMHGVGVAPGKASSAELILALSQVARDYLAERWAATQTADAANKARRVYYFSMEFLIGRTLLNALSALGIYDQAASAFAGYGKNLDELLDQEPDAALGNGGLGRLAACFLDAMATVGLPSFGYGMRYEYGMFAQAIHHGNQIEHPDAWLANGTPWEFQRLSLNYPVRFGGWVEHLDGVCHWRPHDEVLAKGFDMVIPGHGTDKVSTLRLWKATAPADIDLAAFNLGDYARAAEVKNKFENISWVLYPNDSTPAGRELRLRQEYFFVAASMQDILARHLEENPGLENLADKVAIHLNDTHPAISVPELMRLLVDEHGMSWEAAWDQCRRIFSYTNHTLMPEALEIWPVSLIQHVLPRHLEIILHINHDLLEFAGKLHPSDSEFSRRISIIDESGERFVRMAYLSIVGSHKVNGVSQLHSNLMQQTLFADFAALYPDRFTNKTNGITPRRWLAQANPKLSALIDNSIGHGWRTDLGRLGGLTPFASDPSFRDRFAAVKLANKKHLAEYIERVAGVALDPASLFDVQVKRIHEYKRQLLNLLHVVSRYNAIRRDPNAAWVPRSVIFAGKAASAYYIAKLIIRLTHDIAARINADPLTRDKLRLVFIPNYSVSVAELIMPAADLSEQISTAGTEASGTGNMKLALNGALTIGTEDGANIEIREQVGGENMFIFGLSTPQVAELKRSGYHPRSYYDANPVLREVLDQIDSGHFSPDEPVRYQAIVDSLLRHGDQYMLLADYASYVAAQHEVDRVFSQPAEWNRRAILNVAGMGPFSADSVIRDYASEIWHMR